jgi:RNA polymerase sigma-70 factor (ECF subfamily)
VTLERKQSERRTDEALVADAFSGGFASFGPIIERYQAAVFGVALSRLGCFHEAEDVAQEVFVEAFERLGNLREPARLGAWLRSIAIHRSLDALRRRRPDVSLSEGCLQALDEPSPHEQLERQDLRARVLEAIRRLSRAQRETATLFYIDGYTVNEVARMQEAPVGTVKRRLHDARKRLKREMMDMVADVLKSESPGDDFAGRVFALLNQYQREDRLRWRQWRAIFEELKEIGSGGLEGFVRALESQHARTRWFAAKMLMWGALPKEERAIRLLKQALGDPNKKVRVFAARALLSSDVPEERKRREFLPAILPLLRDGSRKVRRVVAWYLRPWASDVPLPLATRAHLDEEHHSTKGALAMLLRRVLDEVETT